MVYKSSSLLNQVENLLPTIPKDTQKKLLERAVYRKGLGSTVNIYVDGSYDKETSIFSWGVVLIDTKHNIEEYNGCARNSESMHRNVAGEIYGSVLACKLAYERGYKTLNLYYDYTGIKEWAEGSWKRNNPLTKRYYEYIQSLNGRLTINFIKVKAHTGDEYNELADTLAKKAIIECKK